MTQEQIEHIEELIQEASYRKDYRLYTNIDSLLEKYEKTDSDYFLVLYYRGLVQYMNPDRDDLSIKLANKYFKKALKMSPNHLMSIIYLGYSLFDEEKYKESLEYFNKVLRSRSFIDQLVQNEQRWRLANIKEMKAIILLKQNKLYEAIKSYDKWHTTYSRLKPSSFYFPSILIIETAYFLSKKGDGLSSINMKYFKRISQYLINLIKKHGYEKLYSKELENLQNWDGHAQPQALEEFSN